jgi:hypothetical protein
VFKPAGVSPVVGWNLCELFREAGLPPGVFNFTPGRGSVMGDYLVEHTAQSSDGRQHSAKNQASWSGFNGRPTPNLIF